MAHARHPSRARTEFAAMKKTVSEAEPAAKPAAKKARAKQPPAPVVEVPPAPASVARKSTAEILREALAAKNAGPAAGAPRLRPQMGGGRVAKDAERRSGKSRKVH